MLLGLGEHGLIKPTKNEKAMCPNCGETLIAKCGEINIWHWAHESADCSIEWEPETDWHRWWKTQFIGARLEVINGAHRADVITNRGLVIEIQSSPIQPEQLQAREAHWQSMIWLINGEQFYDRFITYQRAITRSYSKIPEYYYSFRWKQPRKIWFQAKNPIYIHFPQNQTVFAIKKLYDEIPCRGWGYEYHQDHFINLINQGLIGYESKKDGSESKGNYSSPPESRSLSI